LTNNPDKVQSITALGVTVAERVAMVPRSWQHDQPQHQHPIADASRPLGATLIGGGAVYGEDLDKYIKTKVTKMGHMLELPDSV
jgi:GTP cyclohydrolase II